MKLIPFKIQWWSVRPSALCVCGGGGGGGVRGVKLRGSEIMGKVT